jgi:ATP-dependent Clp protease ATP-binding subunit ClpA
VTSAWRRSTSSTRKTPEHPSRACNLSDTAAATAAIEASEAPTEVAEAATEVAEDATEVAAAAAAAEVVEAAGGGGSSLADGVTEVADFTWWQVSLR